MPKKATAKKATTRKATASKATARKVASKKATAKKVASKKTVSRKTAASAAAPARKTTAVREPMTKSQLLAALSEHTGLARKEVASVLEGLGELVERHLRKRGAGSFTLPGLLKIKTVRKPATKARKMISPFTGEEITVKPKPARTVVKVQPLKGLKKMAE